MATAFRAIPAPPDDLLPMAVEDINYSNAFTLLPGERRGWWAEHTEQRISPCIALVHGAICDHRTPILLDSGSSTSMISLDLARRLKLRLRHDDRLTIKGIGNATSHASARATVKITLGVRVTYKMDVWVTNIGEGLQCLLGMDFMVAAGVRMNLYDGSVMLPDEERVLMLNRDRGPPFVAETSVVNRTAAYIASGDSVQVPIKSQNQNLDKMELWLYRSKYWVTTVVRGSDGVPQSIKVVNISQSSRSIGQNVEVARLTPVGHLPHRGNCVREGSPRYNEWQTLIYENTRSRRQRKLDELENAKLERSLPPVVPKPTYMQPTAILKRERKQVRFAGTVEVLGERESSDVPVTEDMSRKILEEPMVAPLTTSQGKAFLATNLDDVSKAQESLPDATFHHEGGELFADDLRNRLALLPEVGVAEITPPNMDDADIGDDDTAPEVKAKFRDMLRKHQVIFMGKGNSTPPAARGVVCDIDVGEAKPIAQKARRIQQEHLRKLYDIIKNLLEHQLIIFSNSEWASPIVLVVKKNGELRLCVDYRQVNLCTKLLNYPLPLIQDLLDNFETVMWYCSLDMASGFWAVPMTRRASEISAFICPLGHFQWLRMPFGLKNAPLIYQMIIDNALWGFRRLSAREEADVDPEVLAFLKLEGDVRTTDNPVTGGDELFRDGYRVAPTVFTDGRVAPKHMDPVLDRSSYIDDIAFGQITEEALFVMLNRLLYRLRYWRISVSLPKSFFLKKQVEYLSHIISRLGVQTAPKMAAKLKDLPFPRDLKGVQQFLGSLNYYHKFLENFSVTATVLYELTDARIRAGTDLDKAKQAYESLKAALVQAPLLRHPMSDRPYSIILYANTWAISAVLCQEHDGTLHPVRYIGRTLQGAEIRYHRAEREVLALLRVLHTCFHLVVGRELRIYTRFSTLKWLMTSKTLSGRTLQWATMLSPWTFDVFQISKDEDGLAALLAASITPREFLDDAAADLIPEKGVAKVVPRYTSNQIPPNYQGCLITFDGAAKLSKKTGAAGFILWDLPSWTIIHAAGVALTDVTVNEAEYQGMLGGIQAAIDRNIKSVIIVGDSRIAIEQAQGVISCHQAHLRLLLQDLQTKLAMFDSYILVHVKRDFNAPADFVTGLTLKRERTAEITDANELQQIIQLNALMSELRRHETTPPTSVADVGESAQSFVMRTRRQRRVSGAEIDLATNPTPPSISSKGVPPSPEPSQVIDERHKRLITQQEAQPEWRRLKRYLNGELEQLSQSDVKECAKLADCFEVDDRGILIYISAFPTSDTSRNTRIVIPDSLKRDILHMAHDDIQGGHQGILRTFEKCKAEYYWRGMYRDVKRYVTECMDCNTAKGYPSDPGESPGNIVPEGPLDIISMDFAMPLPPSYNGNTALLLFQCMFTGYVMCKPMADTSAQSVAEVYEQVVFRRFGASRLVRHDRDPRFMSRVFNHFRRMMNSQQRATLSYRPQANGQQERSVQTVIKTIKAYVADPAQKDWDELAEKLMFAINTSYDSTRKATPHFLMHGWNAKTTLTAMMSKPPSDVVQRNAHNWRVQVQRQWEYACSLARRLQEQAKTKRAARHNQERDQLKEAQKKPYQPGDQVWMYLPMVKAGLSKKFAHLWHGPFTIKEKGDEYRYKLDLQGTGYRFHPWVHISRLKRCTAAILRPQERLPEVNEEMDWDAALLPEDEADPNEEEGEYEVEKLLDVRWSKRGRQGRHVKEYLVKWVGYGQPTWEPIDRLNCGRLLQEFDQSAKARARFAAMRIDEDAPAE